MSCFLEEELQRLYEMYPRKVGRREALRAIEKALNRIHREKPEIGNAMNFMGEKIREFAESLAGEADGLFPGYNPPYPATWFNKSRYLDDPKEWGITKKGPCTKHPNSGRTPVGTCWDCYSEKHANGASA